MVFWFARKTPFTPRTWDSNPRCVVNTCPEPADRRRVPAACSELCPRGCLHASKSPELRLTVHSGGEWGLGGQGIPDCGPQTLGFRVTQSCHPRPRHWPLDVCRALVLPGLCVMVTPSLPQRSTAPEPWPPSTGPTGPGPLLQAPPNLLSSAPHKEMQVVRSPHPTLARGAGSPCPLSQSFPSAHAVSHTANCRLPSGPIRKVKYQQMLAGQGPDPTEAASPPSS